MAPHAPTQERDHDAGIDDDRVAKQRLLGKRRQHFGNDAHGGQNQDVDLGVPEHPEQLVPEDRVTTALRHEEMRAKEAVEH